MKKLLALLILLFLVAGNAFAQKSLLWKIERKGCQPAYLFGTIHIFPQEKFAMPNKVTRTLAESELLVMELDMAAGTEMKMLTLAPMKNGVTLDDLLSAKDLSLLDSALAESGMSRIMLNTWKPLLITSLFYNQYMESGVASFELALKKLALEASMEIRGLETVERQMEVFEAVPYDSQARDMMEIIKEKVRYRQLFDEIVASYLSEDIDKILALSTREMKDLAEIELFLNSRNVEWIPTMMELMKTKKVFFAVGAGHLGGDKGLINLLQARGFKVTPVVN